MQSNHSGMKNFALSFLVFLFAASVVSAQKADLMVKSSDKGLYLEHKVKSKESFFSIGRLYNCNPKSLATFNNLDMKKGLQIDQKIKIPLTDSNFTQQGNKGTPVYYKTGDKEGLMTVSQKHNDVLLADLRRWNNLSTDEVKKDSRLIIGFLQSKEMPAITITNKLPKEEPVVKVADKPVAPMEVKPEEKVPLKSMEKPEEKVAVKIERNPVSTDLGYFKADFEQQIKTAPVSKNETVTSGVFKTTSGWQDAKYYLLIDKVSPGTIIKLVNPTNKKIVYAKVLGEMSGIRQNEGLTVRISNAAASALEITEEDKFILMINY